MLLESLSMTKESRTSLRGRTRLPATPTSLSIVSLKFKKMFPMRVQIYGVFCKIMIIKQKINRGFICSAKNKQVRVGLHIIVQLLGCPDLILLLRSRQNTNL